MKNLFNNEYQPDELVAVTLPARTWQTIMTLIAEGHNRKSGAIVDFATGKYVNEYDVLEEFYRATGVIQPDDTESLLMYSTRWQEKHKDCVEPGCGEACKAYVKPRAKRKKS